MRTFAFPASITTQTTTLTAFVPPAQLEAMAGTPQPIVEDKGEAPARPAERRTRERWRPIQSAAHLRAELSHSRFLHVAEQGTMLRRSGSRLVVSKKEQVLLDIPAAKLQGVLLYGNVQVSSQCVRNLLEEGVWLAFFSRNGGYRGRLQPPVERGGRLRKRQWTAASDEAFCLAFAKAVVRGKLLAQQQMASAHAKNQLAESLGTAREGIEHGLERLEQAADLAELRGIEGSATRAYFDLFRRWNRSEFTFPGRQKHPSVDPINALLSFGYVMLTTELEGLLEAAGLDPTIGFYHTIGDDRPSLACDWVEEFRHSAIDRLVLNLVNQKTIKAGDFEDLDERRGLRLRPDGLRKYLGAYEQALFQGTTSEDGTATPGIRDVFLGQLVRLLDALNTGATYRAYLDQAEPAAATGAA